MRYVERILPYYNTYNIIPISDAHCGDRNFDEQKLKNLVKDIKNQENTYAVLIGDLINNATKNSKSNVYLDLLSPREQKRHIIEILSEIQHKILGATSGNHEERTSNESGQDITEDIAEALKIPYDPFGILYNIKCGSFKRGKLNYTLYTTHGSAGGGTVGNALNKLLSLKNIVHADLYFMGHTHKIAATKDMVYMPDTRHGKIIKVIRHYAIAGSYLDYGGYAERLCLAPTPTGSPIAHLDGDKKQIKITI